MRKGYGGGVEREADEERVRERIGDRGRENERERETSIRKIERDSESTENPFDYFARPQYMEFDLFFSVPTKTNPPKSHSQCTPLQRWHTHKMADIQ